MRLMRRMSPPTLHSELLLEPNFSYSMSSHGVVSKYGAYFWLCATHTHTHTLGPVNRIKGPERTLRKRFGAQKKPARAPQPSAQLGNYKLYSPVGYQLRQRRRQLSHSAPAHQAFERLLPSKAGNSRRQGESGTCWGPPQAQERAHRAGVASGPRPPPDPSHGTSALPSGSFPDQSGTIIAFHACLMGTLVFASHFFQMAFVTRILKAAYCRTKCMPQGTPGWPECMLQGSLRTLRKRF